MTRDSQVTAAILVGGQARRLAGTDKSQLLVGGRTILDRQISVLRELTPHILLVARDGPPPLSSRFPVVRDPAAGAGPLAGLYAALLNAPTERAVVIACDLPFLTAPFLSRLAALLDDADAAVPHDGRRLHPLCAAYRTGLADRLLEQMNAGVFSVRAALAGCRVREMGPEELSPFDAEGRLLLNVNTPEDYARACAAAAAAPPQF
jgi:molybdenum cofactor guanylyltransferase